MASYAFGKAINMLTFDPSQYTSGSVTGFSSSEVDISDANGDTAVITGTNFNPFSSPPSGTVTGAVLRDANNAVILKAVALHLDLGTLYNDRANKAALFADLFNGGVTITGSTSADVLVGGTGNDTIRGNGGADILIGGAGADNLYGGASNVRFEYRSILDSTYTHPDDIRDFHTGDKIDLRLVDANTALAGRQSFHLGATAGHTGDLVVSYSATTNRTTILLYDNADATPDGRIVLTGNHSGLTTADFLGVTAAPAAAVVSSAHPFVSAMAAFAPAFAGSVHTSETHAARAPMLAMPRMALA